MFAYVKQKYDTNDKNFLQKYSKDYVNSDYKEPVSRRFNLLI